MTNYDNFSHCHLADIFLTSCLVWSCVVLEVLIALHQSCDEDDLLLQHYTLPPVEASWWLLPSSAFGHVWLLDIKSAVEKDA